MKWIFFFLLFVLNYSIPFSDSEIIKKKDYYLVKNARSCIENLESEEDMTENLYIEVKRKSFLDLFSLIGSIPRQISDSSIDSCITSFSLVNEEVVDNQHCMTLDVVFDRKRIEYIKNQKIKSVDRSIRGVERISVAINSDDFDKISLFLTLIDELKIRYRLEIVDNSLIEFRLIEINADNFLFYLKDNDLNPSLQSDGFYLI